MRLMQVNYRGWLASYDRGEFDIRDALAMIRRWRRAALLAVVLILPCLVHASPPNAVVLAIACGGCHGTLGVSAGAVMPSLAGQSQEYLVSAMKRFRSGELPSTVMGRLAQAYSDADIEVMANFFGQLPPPRQAAGPADASLVEKGRLVFYKRCRFCHLDRGPLWRQIHRSADYDAHCRRCHADYGSGGSEATPFIAGQWPGYLALQLEAFRVGARPMSRAKAQALTGLSAEDAAAVAHFYASQMVE